MKVKLKKYIDQYGDGIHGTPKYNENGEYYFINGNNLENGKIVITKDTLKITREEYNKIKRPLNSNTLLLSINGSLGKIAVYDNEKVSLGKSACYLNVNKNENKHFVRYVLSTKEFQKYMMLVAHGSTIKNIAPSQVIDYEFKEPENRNKIALMLKSIDDKIENNNKIISELEQMAKTIYNYWFLQFEFPNENGKPYKSSGGKMVWNEELKKEIPVGWKAKKCRDIVEVMTGKEDANFSTVNGKYKFFTCGQDSFLCDIPKFNGSAILIAGNGNFNVKHYTGEFNAYQRTYVLIPYEIKYYGELYISALYKIKSFKKGSNGSIVKFITKGDVENIDILEPDNNTLLDMVNQIIFTVEKNKKENEELVKLRDFLLPLLMNGQIKFKNK